MNKDKTIFLSYCSVDANIAKMVEDTILSQIGAYVKITNYQRDVGYKKSFKEFMESLGAHDFVLTIVSDNYLKSKACMFEVGELIKDNKYKEKLLFIVLSDADNKYYNSEIKSAGAKIYSPIERTKYIVFWEKEYNDLKASIDDIVSYEAKLLGIEDLKKIRKVIDFDLNPFLSYISDVNGKNFFDLYNQQFIDIINIIQSHKSVTEDEIKVEGYGYKTIKDENAMSEIINLGTVPIYVGYIGTERLICKIDRIIPGASWLESSLKKIVCIGKSENDVTNKMLNCEELSDMKMITRISYDDFVILAQIHEKNIYYSSIPKGDRWSFSEEEIDNHYNAIAVGEDISSLERELMNPLFNSKFLDKNLSAYTVSENIFQDKNCKELVQSINNIMYTQNLEFEEACKKSGVNLEFEITLGKLKNKDAFFSKNT